MGDDCEQVGGVLVWFEDNVGGRSALAEAYALAEQQQEHLTVITVATLERLVGCARCTQGSALWNIEMKKIAREELRTARRTLDGADDVSYQVVIGSPAEAIVEMVARTGAESVLLPPDDSRRFIPSERRNVSRKVVQALGLAHSQIASPSPSVATAQRVT